MVREHRDFADRIKQHPGKTGFGPVLFAAGFFSVVLAVVYWARPTENNAAESTSEAVVATEDSSASATPRPTRPVDTSDDTPVAEESRIVTSSTSAAQVAQVDAELPKASAPPRKYETAAETSQDRRQKLEAQLEAGEFGPALETAKSAPTAEDRAVLLKVVANAQFEAGEFEGALSAIRRVPEDYRQNRKAQAALAGGAMFADFETLKNLIMNETSGLWEEEDGTGGSMSEFPTGVRVDPNGLLRQVTREEQTGRLERLGIRAREADLNEDMSRPSDLRLVSLTRLEQQVAERIAEGKPVVASMQHLAGLSQIRYLFVDEESGEIIIGGPAEGWRYNENGLPVGVDSGRPTLQLDDLVVALRTFSPSGSGIFQCLIVPREEGLQRLKQYVETSNARGPLRAGQVGNWARTLQRLLGEQDVVINGVPENSRVARVIAEADYRMKLIGVGKLDGGPGIASIFDLLPLQLQKDPPALDALRWWLTMKYDAVLHSPDRDVFAIEGSSVLCQSENQILTDAGERISTGKAEATNQLFAEKFTEHYGELAERDLVFADLQNVFDLSLVAAIIHKEQLTNRTGWHLGAFAPNGGYETAVYQAPKTVESVVAHRVYNGRDIVVQVAGGVRGDLLAVVQDENVAQEAPRLQSLAGEGRAPQIPEGRWWWDAKK